MNLDEKLKILTERARGEKPPRMNVGARVISILTDEQNQFGPVSERPLMWVAVFSSAAAIPFAVLAIVAYYTSAGPLAEISQAIAWVMQ